MSIETIIFAYVAASFFGASAWCLFGHDGVDDASGLWAWLLWPLFVPSLWFRWLVNRRRARRRAASRRRLQPRARQIK